MWQPQEWTARGNYDRSTGAIKSTAVTDRMAETVCEALRGGSSLCAYTLYRSVCCRVPQGVASLRADFLVAAVTRRNMHLLDVTHTTRLFYDVLLMSQDTSAQLHFAATLCPALAYPSRRRLRRLFYSRYNYCIEWQ